MGNQAKFNKLDVMESAAKLNIEFDSNIFLAELLNTNIQYCMNVDANRGGIHSSVNSEFLRGGSNAWFFEESIDSYSPENSTLLHKLTYLKTFLNKFPGTKGRVGLFNLMPQKMIPIHIDIDDFNYFNSTLRFHIPIITTSKVLFFCNNYFYTMEPSSVWVINNIKKHGVINEGNTERLHLIFDVYITPELIKMIEEAEWNLGEPISKHKEKYHKLESANKGNTFKPPVDLCSNFVVKNKNARKIIRQQINIHQTQIIELKKLLHPS